MERKPGILAFALAHYQRQTKYVRKKMRTS